MAVFGSLLVAAFTGVAIWMLTKHDDSCIYCNGLVGTSAPFGYGITTFENLPPNFQMPGTINFPSEIQREDTDSFAQVKYRNEMRPGWNSSSSHYSYGSKEIHRPHDLQMAEHNNEENFPGSVFPKCERPVAGTYQNRTKLNWECVA